MGNDLEVSTGNQQVAVRSNEVAKKVSDLERGGYYKNVVSPEDYLAGKNRDGSSKNADLEVYDEQSHDTSSQDNKSRAVAPLKHWNEKIQAKFEECTESQQKAWLDSFKIVEKNFVKQLNYLKDDLEMSRPVMELLAKYEKDLARLQLSPAEYVKILLSFDENMGKDPAYEIAKLICSFKVKYDDIYNCISLAHQDLVDADKMSKYVGPLKQEIANLKSALGYASQDTVNVAEAQDQAENLVKKITMFFEQRYPSGEEMYPGAFDNIQDIIELAQTGEGLEDAYNLVVKGKSKDQDSSIETEGVEYDGLQEERKKRPLTSLEKEKEMLRATLRKIAR